MKKILLSLLVLTSTLGADMLPVMKERYSGRDYDATKNVKKEDLVKLAEAARYTPSSYNEQPWFFIICNKETHPEAYDKAFNGLMEANQKWAKNAPVLVIAIASEKSSRGSENHWAQYDTGAAAYAMMLEATSLGLMAHQMGGFHADKISTAFKLPAHLTPMAVMTVGYAATSETGEKTRKDLETNFFFDGQYK